MNRYNSYKDSGVEWIGEIPKHWSFSKMKYVLSNNDGGVWGNDTINEDDGIIVIRSTEITIDGNWDLSNPIKRVLTENEFLKSKLYEGDIVITKSSGSPQHIGKSVLVDRNIELLNCCYSNFVQRIRFRNFIPKLYHYILNSDIARSQFKFLTTSSTGLGNLNGSSLNDILLPLIPNLEQEQIVAYLDKKTAIVDALITSKEQKVNLLKENRTALINHVISKGLTPNVQFKDSSVEWIGKIPKHWEVKALKYIIKNLNSGTSVNSENNPINESNEKGVLKTSCVYGDVFRPTENKQVVIEEYNRVQCPVIKNTIIISRMNTPDLVGSNGYVDENYPNLFLPDRLWITDFFDNKNLIVKWLSYVFKSNKFKRELSSRSTGTSDSMKNITKDDLLTIKIPFTDIEEQQQISEYLDVHLNEIDELISIEQKKIETLKEYRQALISEVVTGKIKVVKD